MAYCIAMVLIFLKVFLMVASFSISHDCLLCFHIVNTPPKNTCMVPIIHDCSNSNSI